jgi:hypothetical protein
MWLVIGAVEAFGLILGSLAVAIAICAAAWSVSNRLGKPDLALAAIFVLAIAEAFGALPDSLFVRMTVVLCAIVAFPFWIASHARRAERSTNERSDTYGLGGFERGPI